MSRAAEQPVIGRQLGAIGSAARIAGGLAAVVVPIAISGITWWDIGTALLLLPLAATLAAVVTSAALRARSADGDRRGGIEPWVRSSVGLIAAVAVGVAATFVTPLDGSVAIWAFIGVSLLVATLRGDAGCEAVAIPNAIAGRKDPTGCVLYSPLNAIERRRSRDRPSPVDGQEVRS